MLVWMDLEMTGLDPDRHVIVEIATLVTDDDLDVVAEGPDLVIHATEEQLEGMEDIVRRMHTGSGLLEAIRQSAVSLEEAGQESLEFVRRHVRQGETPLCGNSIAVDRMFLRAYLPELDRQFHYRSIDVSTLKELCKRWSPELYAARPHKLTAHRALDDIRESIAELKFYKDHFIQPRAVPDGAQPAEDQPAGDPPAEDQPTETAGE